LIDGFKADLTAVFIHDSQHTT